MTNIVQKKLPEIEKICQEEGISYLALFGSHARGEETSNSDIDLLVKFKNPVDFVELYDTEQKFRTIFQKNVDLVTTTGLSKYIKPYIQADLTTLYEEKS